MNSYPQINGLRRCAINMSGLFVHGCHSSEEINFLSKSNKIFESNYPFMQPNHSATSTASVSASVGGAAAASCLPTSKIMPLSQQPA